MLAFISPSERYYGGYSGGYFGKILVKPKYKTYRVQIVSA